MSWTPLPGIEELLEESLLTELLSQTKEEGATYVHCMYISPFEYVFGGWVNIWPTTFIVDAESGEKMQMSHAIGVPLNPSRHFFKRCGEQKWFTLIFPKMPKDWRQFHLIEYANGKESFQVKDIARNQTDVYKVTLK
jgi:hypothetical protein